MPILVSIHPKGVLGSGTVRSKVDVQPIARDTLVLEKNSL